MHEGHRKRRKEWVSEYGFDNLQAHELLEIMLYYAIPRIDTNEIAHNLIDRFGSLSAVIEAPQKELCEVKGIGFSAALYLKMFSSVMRTCQIEKAGKRISIKDDASLKKYIVSLFEGKTEENLYCICVSRTQTVVSTKLIATGLVDRIEVPVAKLVKTAMMNDATSVIVAHNHPFGSLIFSHEDCRYTNEAKQALNTVGIELLDHYLVCGGECLSFYYGVI